MRFKVPQDVQREDQIVWFLTIRHLVILIIGFGISYTLFTHLNKIYVMDEISNVLTWIPLMIAAAFAFVKVKSVSLFKFILLVIEQNFFRPPRRRWSQRGGTPFMSMTTEEKTKKKKPKKTVQKKKISADKIGDIAKMMDQGGLK